MFSTFGPFILLGPVDVETALNLCWEQLKNIIKVINHIENCKPLYNCDLLLKLYCHFLFLLRSRFFLSETKSSYATWYRLTSRKLTGQYSQEHIRKADIWLARRTVLIEQQRANNEANSKDECSQRRVQFMQQSVLMFSKQWAGEQTSTV